MARRSNRLNKAPPPSAHEATRSDDSWHTASPPHAALPVLPEMPALPDPGTQADLKAAANRAASRLPKVAATPHKSKPSNASLAASASRTPSDRTPIKAPGQEMHPAHHHASTAKVLDEARWLGFQSLDAQTAVGTTGPGTPSKTPARAPHAMHADSSPDLRFKSPFKAHKGSMQDEAGLSPSSRDILDDAATTVTSAGASRAIFDTTGFSTKADVSPPRKKAEAKGKMARFSDVHLAQFKKMDSIANHASAFRADPTRFKPVGAHPLSKSPSKPDLAKPEAGKLKRTQSKMNVSSSLETGNSASSMPLTPLKRTKSKSDLVGSDLPRSQSSVRLVPPRNERPTSREGDGNIPAKRFKRTEVDDASTTRPMSRDGRPVAQATSLATPARKITSQTALPRITASLMTPTKASLARSQSVKAAKAASTIPSLMNSPSTTNLLPSPSPVKLVKGPSTNNLFSPTHLGQTMRDGARESMRQASRNLQRVRSILRTPSRKFSNDPTKLAAGTHMSPPPCYLSGTATPSIPATAPVKKHVNFSSSTLERASDDALGKSPSPMKLRAGSEVPMGAVIYPTLRTNGAPYPDLAQELVQDDVTQMASPARRLTFGSESADNRDFSFKAGKPLNFGPASTGTIRMVRQSDVSSLVDGKKRRLETLQESSDKENQQGAEVTTRAAKKMKPTLPDPPATPAKASRLPRRTPGRSSTISRSRLNFLSTPKRSKM